MKNFVINLLIAVLVFTGCNREDDITPSVLDKDTGFRTPITENSDNYTVTYQFNDGVMVLNDKAADLSLRWWLTQYCTSMPQHLKKWFPPSATSFPVASNNNCLTDWATRCFRYPKKMACTNALQPLPRWTKSSRIWFSTPSYP